MLIVSRMARGIDSAAHRGASAAGKPTVAVWGTGADLIYPICPKEKKKLAEEILATGGAIVSELPLGTFPAPKNSPWGNRIPSGVSVGGLVVEAARTPGRAGHGPLRGRPGAGCSCGSGECNEQAMVDAEHTDQTGRAAYGGLGGCVRGAVVAGTAGVRSGVVG
jgi:hypothetical protein